MYMHIYKLISIYIRIYTYFKFMDIYMHNKFKIRIYTHIRIYIDI